MSRLSSYQKLKAENKNFRDKISDIEHMFGTMDENERSMIDCAGFIAMCRTKIEMERVVMFGDSKREAGKMYLAGSLWDSPQVIKPSKISWFSKIINKFTKK